MLKVTIADNGNGFNADNAVSKHSGLGLSNIRHRVGMLEGSVDIASAVQQGTTVTLYIPHKQ